MPQTENMSIDWALWFINEFSFETRRLSGETHDPYPDPREHPESPAAFTAYDDQTCASIADSLFTVFEASPDKEAMAQALHAVFATPVEVRPAVVDDQIVLAFGDSGEYALGPEIARCLIDSLADHRVNGLGVCQETACVDVYIDRSRQNNRRYCTTTCQVRSRVARHRQR